MRVWPLIERELRMALRREHPWRRRLTFGGLAVGICALLMLLAGLFGSQSTGRGVKNVLLMFGLYTCVSLPGQIAGMIAAERRQQTLDLLFLTGLGPVEVFLGKLTGALMVAVGDLLLLVPLLALPFLIGGVNFETFLGMAICLPVLLFWVVALSLFLSCLARNEDAAYFLTLVTGAVWCGLAPLAWWAAQWLLPAGGPGTGGSYGWLVTSPALGPWLTYKGLDGTNAAAFWTGQALTAGSSLALVLGAAVALLWRWRRDLNRASFRTRPVWPRFLERLTGLTPAQRRAWLEDNPALWLELHRPRPVWLGWLALGATALLWLAGWAVFRGAWLGPWNFFLTAAILNGSLVLLGQHATAASMAEGRHSGAWELVLTTPLSPEQIVRAVEAAPQHRLHRLSRVAFLVQGLVATSALASRDWSPAALLNFGLIVFTVLMWTWHLNWGRWAQNTAWVALNSGRTWMAITGLAGAKSAFAYFFVMACVKARSCTGPRSNEPGFPTGSVAETVLVIFLFIIFWLIVWAVSQQPDEPREKLIAEFREIVREPVPAPDDPRFKEWREPMKTRFPWGPERFPDELADRMARRQAAVKRP